ncbi:hypothetical protein BEUL_1575 [Bifidobacterium eulemuris]|uniref:Uncharacterized protein n=1 Tax=Bifidobacterium eulemuris TaxID=1765219 RepID=A0A261G7U3_9BIFI|nr:hypothetical protein BEUL_1575 [Bifidobacterium eulemuris]
MGREGTDRTDATGGDSDGPGQRGAGRRDADGTGRVRTVRGAFRGRGKEETRPRKRYGMALGQPLRPEVATPWTRCFWKNRKIRTDGRMEIEAMANMAP